MGYREKAGIRDLKGKYSDRVAHVAQNLPGEL